MSKKQLIELAKELDDLLFEKPTVKTNVSEEELIQQITKAARLLEEGDELENFKVLKSLMTPEVIDGLDLEEEQIANLTALGLISEDEKEEEEPKAEEEEPKEEDGLYEQVKEAGSLRELRDISKSNPEFKSIRGRLSKYKTKEHVKDLQDVMLDILDSDLPEKVVAKKPENSQQEKKSQPSKKDAPPKKETSSKQKNPGVISTIVSCVADSDKKGVSKDEIHKLLVKQFPDRDEKSMRRTIDTQIPYRVNKEKFELEKLDNGNYRKKSQR